MYFLNPNETNYFFSQSDYSNKSIKRPKKQLNPQLLNKKLNNKFQTDDLLTDDTNDEKRTIASRLATIQPRQSVASIREPSAISHSNNNQTAATPVASNSIVPVSSNPRAVSNPNAFTDTRLQAIRFLTDDLIKQLEEYLNIFFKAEIVPILPGQVIYDCHSDWSDLTDKATYDNFPVWQTKNGQARLGSSHRRSQLSNEDQNMNGQNKSDPNAKGRQGKRNSIKPDDSMSNFDQLESQKDGLSSRKSNSNYKLAKSPTSKLSSITESKNDLSSSSRNQVSNKHVSISSNKNLMSPIPQLNSGGVAVPTAFKASRNDTHSRLTLNASVLSGCLVNYQLSQPVYKEKGWTVVTVTEEEKQAENEKRILNCLRSSLKNM